jgi:YesN/AraC family two-component response regulator
VNAGVGGLREAWTDAFAGPCEIREIESAELLTADPGGSWDLICFNFDFPGMAVLRLIPETKKRWPSAPIVMITMQNSAELALWALRSRVFDLLVKPVARQEIDRCMRRVRGVLQARRSQTERIPQGSIGQLPTEARYRPHTAPPTRLQLALAHVAKHYLRHIPESEVALACEMSPSRFCREFKAAFGVTFLEYLSSYRIDKAKRLLANPTISVTDVAAAVGFTDPSYFTRVFRKQEGVSPTEYRAAPAEADADEMSAYSA